MPLDAKTRRWGVGRKTRPSGSQTKNVGEDGGGVRESQYWMQKEDYARVDSVRAGGGWFGVHEPMLLARKEVC